MKLWHNQGTRRTAAIRSSASADGGIGSPAASAASDGAFRPSASTFWLVLHGLCCLISLFLGFRFSRLIFFLLFSAPALYTLTTTTTTTTTTTRTETLTFAFPLTHSPPSHSIPQNNSVPDTTKTTAKPTEKHSQVVVGRHGIRIRPWPHPDPTEVMRAHRIMDRVQQEQRRWYGVKNPRPLIVITPTYARTFQALHLTGLIHCLRNAPYPLTWIVIESGGPTNETASLLARSRLQFLHIPFHEKMPSEWGERHLMENRMRLLGLRVIRERNMDGIVLFADDSNTHSLELFDEVQKVKWMGALSVGLLTEQQDQQQKPDSQTQISIQGPACNSSGQLSGWHALSSAQMEWAGFIFNSRMLWKDVEGKPEWVKDLDELGQNGEEIGSPLALLKDGSFVEPLGNCGKKVLLWWLRVEARADSKFPSGWIIDPPLEIVVPAKRTPWQESNPNDLSDRRSLNTKSRNSSKRKPSFPTEE